MGIEPLPVKIGQPDRADAGLRRADPGRWRPAPGPGELGAIAIKLPLPPGTLPTCGTPRSASAKLPEHFPGYYETGDAGMIDEDGYLYIMARTDDVINVAGHRLSTGGMEEVLAAIRTWPNAP